MNLLQDIRERLAFFPGMYDTIRIVDPENKIAFIEQDGKLIPDKIKCFEALGKTAPCLNCISMHALSEMEASVKVETATDGEKATGYELIWACPIEYDGHKYICELIKNMNHESFDDEASNEAAARRNEFLSKQIDLLNRELLEDALTGAYNRKFINEHLPVDISYAKKTNFPIALIMLDIDHFKDFNDTYGHQAGDAALRTVANCLKAAFLKNENWVARYGGEEFLVLLRGPFVNDIPKQLSLIRTQLKDTGFEYGDKKLSITASYGISKWKGGETPEEFIKRADFKMYTAKSSGRDTFEADPSLFRLWTDLDKQERAAAKQK